MAVQEKCFCCRDPNENGSWHKKRWQHRVVCRDPKILIHSKFHWLRIRIMIIRIIIKPNMRVILLLFYTPTKSNIGWKMMQVSERSLASTLLRLWSETLIIKRWLLNNCRAVIRYDKIIVKEWTSRRPQDPTSFV